MNKSGRPGNLQNHLTFEPVEASGKPWLSDHKLQAWEKDYRPLWLDWLERFTIVFMCLVMAWMAALQVGKALAQQAITVYTVSAAPVQIPAGQRPVTRVIELDRILQIENELADGLEKLDPEVAVQTARSRMDERDRRELTLAWQGLARVQSGEITHLPAIIFDGRTVWYGNSFRRGMAAYRTHCQENQECLP